MTRRNGLPFMVKKYVMERDKYRCSLCGTSNLDMQLHVDHIIPVDMGGSDELDNLTTLCKDCNLSKSDFIIKKINTSESQKDKLIRLLVQTLQDKDEELDKCYDMINKANIVLKEKLINRRGGFNG
jgi:5-methylcytosine-specific restriction endonuclease McrA